MCIRDRPFPISVDFTDAQRPESTLDSYTERSTLLKALGVEATFMGVGVDRVDYTKGILERFLAIERFLEKYPPYQGKFTFVQIGAPSRSHLKRYHDLMVEVEAEAERINSRFQTDRWKPIVFLNRQHNHQEIQRYYRAADLCLSLIHISSHRDADPGTCGLGDRVRCKSGSAQHSEAHQVRQDVYKRQTLS